MRALATDLIATAERQARYDTVKPNKFVDRNKFKKSKVQTNEAVEVEVKDELMEQDLCSSTNLLQHIPEIAKDLLASGMDGHGSGSY